MLIFLYFCTGFAIAGVVASMANVVAYAWYGVRSRMESGESGNVKGGALTEMAIGWTALGVSVSVIIMLSALYP
ncbi:MAG: hypothetical protein HQ510_01840 [Candidatus Marinimicrobia bacterium]|nr:hypothetical protein [Candidatus Neomarinimicrobiota bacterium]